MKKLLLLALLPITAIAAPIKGINETYQDWNLVCDNTGTCRMSGYQTDRSDSQPVSILFTRKAGDFEAVSAELFFTISMKMIRKFPLAKLQKFCLTGNRSARSLMIKMIKAH